jgi:hypothetical protein
VSWNTANPATAAPGIYRLIVSQLNGCTCPDADTAFVYVNAYSGQAMRVCANGNTSFLSNVTGASYQWQVNGGSGFVNLADNANYSNVNSQLLKLAGIPSSWYGNQYRCLVNGNLYSNIDTLKITAYWTGSMNADWETPANWGCGIVPDLNTDVIIYNGKPNYPEVTCNRICRSITANPGTSVKVDDSKIFMIKGRN